MPNNKNLFQTFGKEYLLLHEVLATLRKVGLTITSTGSEEKGYIPLYEFQIPTARLHFGTLVGLLNNPEDFKPEPGQIQYLTNIRTTKEQVKETKYKWDEVAIAVETLVGTEEVTKEIIGQFIDLEGKIIQLTAKGLNSLNSKKYLKKYQRERNELRAQESTMTTNFWMRWFTGILAFSSIAGLTFQFSTCNKEKTTYIDSTCCCLQKKDSTRIITDSVNHSYFGKDSNHIKTDSLNPKVK